jgi:hypothetical protein
VAGRAYVFSRTASGWKQAAELKGTGVVSGDQFGYSAAISGTTALVGSYGDLAYLFTDTASGWKQAAELKGTGTGTASAFGYSVAISATNAVVGAFGGISGHLGGSAYLFEA